MIKRARANSGLNESGGFATVTIDSVRLDSVNGMPTGINWIKNPNVLPGGGFGCVEFTGTTSDSAGTYNLAYVGTVWVHIYAIGGLINTDTMLVNQNLNRPPFRNYYLVVDSLPTPLAITTTGRNLCFGDTSAGEYS